MQKVTKFFKKLMPRTLFGRSLLIIITPVLLLQIIVTVIFFDRHWSTMTSRLAFAVAGEIAIIAEQIENQPNTEIEKLSPLLAGSLSLLTSYEPGQSLSPPTESWYPPVEQKLAEALQTKLHRPFIIEPNTKEKWWLISVALEEGILHVTLPENRLYSSTTYIFFLWMAGSSLILVVLAVLFMRNQIRPIRRLANAAERFGKGMEFPALRPQGASEVRMATEAFLEMQSRITRQIEQRTAMLAGVSHDLRTPLTRMKLQIAMLGDSPDTESLKSDITEMETMVEGYLDFTRGLGEEQTQRINLIDTLERIVMGAKRQGAEIQLTHEGSLEAVLRPNAIERCITNLVTNAKKYGERVWIHAYRQNEMLVVQVDDDGPGIPEDKLADAFKPFFRIDPSRNAATGGIGLGLSIAQDIAHAHGGKIWLEKSNRGGLRAIISLPV